MGFAYECNFKLKDCIRNLGLEERGKVQQTVTNEVMKLSDDYVPFDLAGLYENPGRLKDSAHIENGTEVVWNAPYARRWYYEDANFQGAPVRGTYWVPRTDQGSCQKGVKRMTVSESVINWLKGFDIARVNEINTDLLPAEVKSYSLAKEPVQNVQHFLSGRKVITDHFTIQARLASRTNAARMENSGFGEALEEWIFRQNTAGNYPEVENAKVQKVSVTTPFYLGQTQEHDSVYQMTVAIQYMKEN